MSRHGPDTGRQAGGWTSAVRRSRVEAKEIKDKASEFSLELFFLDLQNPAEYSSLKLGGM